MRVTPYALLAAAILAGIAPEARATNGAWPIATGAHAGGRGGVDTAIADDASAINTNPGGIGFIDGQRFDSVTAWVHPNVGFSGRNRDPNDPLDPSGESGANTFGGSMAIVFDFDEPWHLDEALTFQDSDTWAYAPRTSADYQGSGLKIGFGIFPLAGGRVKLNAVTPFWDAHDGLPREEQHWETDIKELVAGPAVALRLAPWLSIGVTAQFVYGEINQNQPQAQPSTILAGHPLGTSGVTYGEAARVIGVDQIEGFGRIHHARTYGARFRIGALLQPLEWLSFGISYASPTFKQDYLGTADIDFSRQVEDLGTRPGFAGVIGGSLKTIIAANTGVPESEQTYRGRYDLRIFAKDEPQEVSLGVAFRFPYVTFGTDIRWINWSGSYRSFRARLTHGTSPELNELTGDTSGTVLNEVPLDWEDQFVFALGLAVQPGVDWMTIRAGYNYGKNPVPQSTLQPSVPAILEHHVTLGLSFYVKRIEIVFNFEQDLRSRAKITSSRANADLDGTEMDAAVQFFAVGFGVRF
jgi:long-subunit fatty acid transport protein